MKQQIYDNSNIAESYSGVSTPLTFSFVNHVYRGVYGFFCKMMGVSNGVIKENERMFAHMVEFIGYRIYYNLSNWYLMISFFPGYRFSSRFMEKMMGVEKENNAKKNQDCGFFRKYFIYFIGALSRAVKISIVFTFLGLRIRRFNKYFDKIFNKINSADLNKLGLKELKNLYTDLDNKLLSRWSVPIANDFAVMVSAGLADKLFKKWLNSNDAYLHMKPSANKPLVTLDPGSRIIQIIKAIKRDSGIHDLFLGDCADGDVVRILNNQYADHQVSSSIDAYLKEFGAKIPNELKLESETLSENPEVFIALVRNIIRREIISESQPTAQLALDAYGKPGAVKGICLKWLLRWAGNSIQRREETRFRRALIFGYVRKIFLGIGEELSKRQFINDKRDIFFLTMEEIFGHIDNQAPGLNPRITIERRKKDFQTWADIELPRRIETQKDIKEIESEYLNGYADAEQNIESRLRGMVACRPKGVQFFFGTALTLKDFNPTADFNGKILVTRQTDPGWVIIFPFLKGLVVERGGMLSHAAIAARELNIPCIVGVENATDIIVDGAGIELDLLNGKVCKP